MTKQEAQRLLRAADIVEIKMSIGKYLGYIDLLHVSAGTYQIGFADTHPSMFKAHGCNVYLAEEIKKHVSVPVATIGALNDPTQMEDIIASGKADVVYMARALLADPFLPRKITENRDEEIVRCLRCFVCMAERAQTATRRCAVNPLIGRELEGNEIRPASEKKKVIVGVRVQNSEIMDIQRYNRATYLASQKASFQRFLCRKPLVGCSCRKKEATGKTD